MNFRQGWGIPLRGGVRIDNRIRQIYDSHRYEILLLLVFTVAAFLTRFYNISNQTLWWDEFGTHFFGKWTFSDIARTDNNSPTYYLLEGWIVKTFGKTELSIKFLSAFFGALMVPLMFLIAEKMFGSKGFSILVTSICLASPLLIHYSQEARAFSFGMFLLMVGFYAFLFAISNNRWVPCVVFAVFGALSIHMQYVFAIPVALLFMFLTIQRVIGFFRGGHSVSELPVLSHLLLSYVVFLIVIIPIISAFRQSYKISMNLPDTWSTGWTFVKESMFDFLFQNVYIEWVLAVAILVGFAFMLYKHTDRGVLLGTMCVIPLVALTVLSFQTHVHQRYMIYIVPFLYILAGGIVLISERWKKDAGVPVAIVCSLLLIGSVAPILGDYYTASQDQSFKAGAKILSEVVEEGDCIVYDPKWLYWGFEGGLSFYFDSEDKDIPIYGVDTVEDVESVIGGASYNHLYLLFYVKDTVFEWAMAQPGSELVFDGSISIIKMTL